MAWGVFLGVLPDMDFIVAPVLRTAREVAWHRGPMHSLLVMALGSWALAHVFAKLWRPEKIGKPLAGAFVAAVWWAHLLVACFSVEGAALLWPFVDQRFTFAFLSPYDFLFGTPLVVCALWLAVIPQPSPPKKTRGKKAPPPARSKRLKICWWGLGLAGGYAVLALGMKSLATKGFDADLARRGTTSTRRLEMPTRFNIFLWRAVVDRGTEFWVGYHSIFDSRDAPIRWTIYPQAADALAPVADMRETKTLCAVSDGWWLARPHVKGAWLGDLRYPESRVWGSKKGMVDSRLVRSWVIDSSENSDHLRDISGHEQNSSDYLRRLTARMFSGRQDQWEAIPRLAGVAGSLPEFLPVEE